MKRSRIACAAAVLLIQAPAVRAGEPAAAHARPADTGALTLEASPLARFFGLTDPAADATRRDAFSRVPPALRDDPYDRTLSDSFLRHQPARGQSADAPARPAPVVPAAGQPEPARPAPAPDTAAAPWDFSVPVVAPASGHAAGVDGLAVSDSFTVPATGHAGASQDAAYPVRSASTGASFGGEASWTGASLPVVAPVAPRSASYAVAASARPVAVASAVQPIANASTTANLWVSNYVGYSQGTVPAFAATASSATTASGYTAPGGFGDAEGVAVYSPTNTLFVADAVTGTVGTYNATTGAVINSHFLSGLSTPVGLALSGTTLYVAANTGGQVLTYNALTGAALGTTISVASPYGLAVSGGYLYVSSNASVASGTNEVNAGSVHVFTTGGGVFYTITGLNNPVGVAVYNNDLFVAIGGTYNTSTDRFSGTTVSEYNASVGPLVNANFATGLNGPYGLAVLGSDLLVTNNNGTTVSEFSIPATAGTAGTLVNASFITGLSNPDFITTPVPEPATWLAGALTLAAAALTLRRRLRTAPRV